MKTLTVTTLALNYLTSLTQRLYTLTKHKTLIKINSPNCLNSPSYRPHFHLALQRKRCCMTRLVSLVLVCKVQRPTQSSHAGTVTAPHYIALAAIRSPWIHRSRQQDAKASTDLPSPLFTANKRVDILLTNKAANGRTSIISPRRTPLLCFPRGARPMWRRGRGWRWKVLV